MFKPGQYLHYKGNTYTVVGLAKQTESGEKLVLYFSNGGSPDLQEEYGEIPYFVRPYEMFIGDVNYNGSKVERFKYIGK